MSAMSRLFLLFCLPLLPTCVHADDAGRQALADIDRDVWSNFVEGVATFDHARYGGVRSRESIFIDGRRLFDYGEYVEDALVVMQPMQAAGSRVRIEVRFRQRVTDGAQAWEQGLLRSTITAADGAQLGEGYAHFDAVLRKESGGWRILTERRWRSGDATADAAAFAAARAPGEFDAFLAPATPPPPPPPPAAR
jgi:hypothetical protein